MDIQKDKAAELMPVIPLQGMVILPETVIHIDLNKDRSIKALEQAMKGGGRVFAVAQKEVVAEQEEQEILYEVGVIASVKQVIKLPGQVVRILAEGKERGRLVEFNHENRQYTEAWVLSLKTQDPSETGQDAVQEKQALRVAMVRQLKEYLTAFAAYFPKLDKNALQRYAHVQSPGSLVDQIAMNLPLEVAKRQEILETLSVEKRYELICQHLLNEIEIAKARQELVDRMKGQVDKNQKEYLLREQLRYIKEELGDDNSLSDAEQFEESVEQLQAAQEVKARIRKEISRFQKLVGSSSESAVERAYIETLLELPWDAVSVDNENMKLAREILEADHYGLEKVKERILEFLAVRCLTKKGESPIICLVGPPGTGKTSVARSVARALNKKYVRICLGGVRDEAEIRGHRKTYVGAMPGRIAAGLRQAGVKNPLMLLDEIDKVSNDYKGDTFSALLEVLDSEQNVRFRDHYVEIPIDLGEVLFIATANSTQSIPRPLLDRMEIIEVNSYTENEKFHIAKEHLLKKQYVKNGLTRKMLSIQDSALKNIITYYTKEAGVRELERKIGDICRKAAMEILEEREKRMEEENNEPIPRISVKAADLEHYLGKHKYSLNKTDKSPQVGIVRGLAWTSVGGDTLQIEVNCMPGKGEIELTGQMGDVMKESAMIGMSYVRSVGTEYAVDPELFQKNDFHIHIPEGAVPKDGPSAGITMATALLSAVTQRSVRSNLAMTGEITLRGRVLPVGGLKEKVLAARMAGVKEILVPAENKKDIEEIAEEIREGMIITYVKDMKEVAKRALL